LRPLLLGGEDEAPFPVKEGAGRREGSGEFENDPPAQRAELAELQLERVFDGRGDVVTDLERLNVSVSPETSVFDGTSVVGLVVGAKVAFIFRRSL